MLKSLLHTVLLGLVQAAQLEQGQLTVISRLRGELSRDVCDTCVITVKFFQETVLVHIRTIQRLIKRVGLPTDVRK
jgi:hypothetical protein